MNDFSITFLDPYIANEQELGIVSNDEIINEFSKIPWYENIMDCFYEESSANRPAGYVEKKGRTMIENHHWYFGIKSNYMGKKRILYIIPNYANDIDFKENDIRFSMEYMRPKKEKTSKFARFFGAEPEKIKKEYLTHVTKVTYEKTLKIITLFGNENTRALDEIINIKGSIY